MTKEEFIKLIESLDFEELCCATINYRKKKPSMYTDDDDSEIKTLCLGENLYREIEKLRNEFNSEMYLAKNQFMEYVKEELKRNNGK